MFFYCGCSFEKLRSQTKKKSWYVFFKSLVKRRVPQNWTCLVQCSLPTVQNMTDHWCYRFMQQQFKMRTSAPPFSVSYMLQCNELLNKQRLKQDVLCCKCRTSTGKHNFLLELSALIKITKDHPSSQNGSILTGHTRTCHHDNYEEYGQQYTVFLSGTKQFGTFINFGNQLTAIM